MRLFNASLFITLACMGSMFQGHAQVTITKDNFPRLAGFTDTIIQGISVGSLPQEGPDQVWDYSDMGISELIEIEYFDAADDPYIPGALNVRERNLLFQQFFIPSNAYEAIDNEGWHDIGKVNAQTGYSIAALTGGPNDSLVFVGSADVYQGRINLVQFPMTYGSSWSGSYVESTNFELTVAAFGLNHVPGAQKRRHTQHREVVGYGTMMIPQVDGNPSGNLDVLMMKVVRSSQDSFFLGGAPAPPALTAAFGLVQGSMAADSFYVFYKPDFGGYVFSIDIYGNQPGDPFCHPKAAETATAVDEIFNSVFRAYPNPVTAGETFHLAIDSDLISGTVQFIDLTGREVYQTQFDSIAGQIEVSVPSTLAPGMLLLQLRDQYGQVLGWQKVQVY